MAPTWAGPGLLLFKRNIENRTRPKDPFHFFSGAVRLFRFFVSKGAPSILLKSPLVISGVKRSIRTILCFIKEEAEVRKQEFFMKTSYATFKNCDF